MGTLGTHAGQLERWLGAEELARISDSMRSWYGPPIALGGVPGRVFAGRGGDFRGRIDAGGASSLACWIEGKVRRLPGALRRAARRQLAQVNTGFAGLSDMVSEITTNGKGRPWNFQKAGQTGVVAATSSLFRVGNQPAAGAVAASAPGGTVPTKTTTGALWNFDNPTGGDTTHLLWGAAMSTVAPNTLLLYDRIFAVAKTMNSTATQAVTGVPTRYQSTTPGAQDSAEGNFLFLEIGTALAATAHNWTVCTYTDQGGAAGTLPSLTGNSGGIAGRIDHPTGQWFAPLATGDTGIAALTQMQCSAAVATGTIDFVIGHPLMLIPCLLANAPSLVGSISNPNLTRVFDDACIAALEITKSATGATTYNGFVMAGQG